MTLPLPSRHTRLAVLLLPVLVVVAVLGPCTPAGALPLGPLPLGPLALGALPLGALPLGALPVGGSARPAGVWPLQPRPEVVARFDAPDTRWGAGHRGVDLRGTAGQAVHAAEAGTVTFAGRIAGRGVVVVDHGGTRTTYEPVAASVSVGDAVVAGAVVGRLTLAGSHCFPGACLHWGLIAGASTYRDPLTLVGGGPVRLLPLSGPLPGGPTPLLPLSGPLPGGSGRLQPLAPLRTVVPAGSGGRDAWLTIAPTSTPTPPSPHSAAAPSLPGPTGVPRPAGSAPAFRWPPT